MFHAIRPSYLHLSLRSSTLSGHPSSSYKDRSLHVTQKPLHTDAFAQRLYTQTFLHTEIFNRHKTNTHRSLTDAFTHRCFYTHTLLHTDVVTHKRFYTQMHLHTEAFSHRSFYTQTLLHREALTHRRFNTQTLLHADAFTHRLLYTRTLLHRRFYTQTLLHTDAFTHRCFYTQTLFTQHFYTQTPSDTHTLLLRTVLSTCYVECIGRAKNTAFILIRMDESWDMAKHDGRRKSIL